MEIKNLNTGATFQVKEDVGNRLLNKRKGDFAIVKNQSTDLSSKTIDELKAIAKDKGIASYSKLTKEELIKEIEGK